MRYRFSVVLAGAGLALAGLVAVGAGSAGASQVTPSATAGPVDTPTPGPTVTRTPGPVDTPTPGPTVTRTPGPVDTPTPGPTVTPSSPPITCPPMLPISGGVAAVTATSVTIRYSIYLSPPCGYNPPITVTLFASRADAEQWQNPVAEAVSGMERVGNVTIDGLTPDTEYWVRFSGNGRREPYVIATARTAPVPVCAATMAIDHGWSGGFVATVTVRNVGAETLDGWRVSWRWSGDEQIRAVWKAAAEATGADVTVRNASYNGTLAPGASTTFGLLVTASGPSEGFALNCGR